LTVAPADHGEEAAGVRDELAATPECLDVLVDRHPDTFDRSFHCLRTESEGPELMSGADQHHVPEVLRPEESFRQGTGVQLDEGVPDEPRPDLFVQLTDGGNPCR